MAPGLADTPGAGPSTPGTPTVMTPEQQAARKLENKLKMNVLKKNPNLWALHKELVRGQQISEKEFWEGREVSLLSGDHGLCKGERISVMRSVNGPQGVSLVSRGVHCAPKGSLKGNGEPLWQRCSCMLCWTRQHGDRMSRSVDLQDMSDEIR